MQLLKYGNKNQRDGAPRTVALNEGYLAVAVDQKAMQRGEQCRLICVATHGLEERSRLCVDIAEVERTA